MDAVTEKTARIVESFGPKTPSDKVYNFIKRMNTTIAASAVRLRRGGERVADPEWVGGQFLRCWGEKITKVKEFMRARWPVGKPRHNHYKFFDKIKKRQPERLAFDDPADWELKGIQNKIKKDK